MIITSASLRRTHWETVSQLGWYADFGTISLETESWGDMMSDAEKGKDATPVFEQELTTFLDDLDLDALDFLVDVNFTNLSPCVRLVTSKLGEPLLLFSRFLTHH